MINREGAVERMRELVAAKTPFVHQGRTVQGIDCVGALAYAFQYQGEVPAYPEDPVNGELERELIRVFGQPQLYRASLLEHPVVIQDLRVGDVVSMQYRGPVRHVGLVGDYPYPGELSLIHTDAILKKVTEHRFDQKWLRRVVGVWRP